MGFSVRCQWIIQYEISIFYAYALPCQDISGKVSAIITLHQLLHVTRIFLCLKIKCTC